MATPEQKLARAKRFHEQARDAFHASIREANAGGLSTRSIAAVVGLSHQRIHQILHGR